MTVSYRLFSCIARVVSICIAFAVLLIIMPIAFPVIFLLRAAPIDHAIALLQRLKARAFRVIGALKPVYRESYDSDGLCFHARC